MTTNYRNDSYDRITARLRNAPREQRPAGCAYCNRPVDHTPAELEACAADFWRRHDARKRHERGEA
jgi:hypothetical protein